MKYFQMKIFQYFKNTNLASFHIHVYFRLFDFILVVQIMYLYHSCLKIHVIIRTSYTNKHSALKIHQVTKVFREAFWANSESSYYNDGIEFLHINSYV